MRQIALTTLTNQNISSGILCYTYTADADREIFFRLFADQIAGDGTYTAYTTIRRLGAGAEYEIQPRTSASVTSGILSVGFTTIPIPVKNTDVIKVYIDGITTDITTPDVITEVWEADYSRPTIPGQHYVDITPTGAIGIDWSNIESPTTTVDLANTTIKNVNDLTDPPTVNQIADQVWDETLADHLMSDSTGEALDNSGGGGVSITAADVWSYNTRTITGLSITVQDLLDSLDETIVNIRRGDTYTQVFNSPEVLSGYTNIWMTLKGNINRTELDSDAIFQIKINASGVGNGLVYLNGASSADSSLGSLTIDIINNTVTAELHQDVTTSFTPVISKPVDIQMSKDGDIKTIVDGTARIYGDVTRSLS